MAQAGFREIAQLLEHVIVVGRLRIGTGLIGATGHGTVRHRIQERRLNLRAGIWRWNIQSYFRSLRSLSLIIAQRRRMRHYGSRRGGWVRHFDTFNFFFV